MILVEIHFQSFTWLSGCWKASWKRWHSIEQIPWTPWGRESDSGLWTGQVLGSWGIFFWPDISPGWTTPRLLKLKAWMASEHISDMYTSRHWPTSVGQKSDLAVMPEARFTRSAYDEFWDGLSDPHRTWPRMWMVWMGLALHHLMSQLRLLFHTLFT